ncbi:hypothetical protein LZU85_14660 [Vibrio sp. IRLE0018]|nr:hypothetical protein [Vibrio floridensis]
MAFLVCGEFWW